MTIERWGVELGRLSVVWYDLWAGHWGLEIAWLARRGRGYDRLLLSLGFGGKP